MGSKIERIEQKIMLFPSLSAIPFTPFVSKSKKNSAFLKKLFPHFQLRPIILKQTTKYIEKLLFE